jgi:hypothetical protein
MESIQEKYQREHLENIQFEENKKLEELELEDIRQGELSEQEDTLIAYIGKDAFSFISNMQENVISNIYDAMSEYAYNKNTNN